MHQPRTRFRLAQKNASSTLPVNADWLRSRARHIVMQACVVLLVACGGGGGSPGETSGAPALTATPRVAPGTWVVMGSSTASGAGATALSWPNALQARYLARSVIVANIAKGSTTTYDGLPGTSAPVPGRPAPDPASNVDAALALSPKLLLVSYPSNDTAFGFGVDETVRNVLVIRSAAQARGVAVIVLSTQPAALTASQLALLPQIDSRLSAEVGPCFVAVREALAAPDGTLAPEFDSGDGLHPNDAGHAVIFSRVSKVIDSGRCVRTQ